MTEYWLQKKTIGGWSMVTWYSELEQALANYAKCVGKGDSGYSWRLVKTDTLAESMLEETTAVEAPELEVKTTSWGATIKPKPVLDYPRPITNGWADTANGWNSNVSVNVVNKPEHGMVGKVWMMHHAKKIRARVDESAIERHTTEGWIKAGPKTPFEG